MPPFRGCMDEDREHELLHELSCIDDNLKEALRENASLNSTIESHECTITEYESALDQKNDEIGFLNGKIHALEDSIYELECEVDSLNTRLNDSETLTPLIVNYYMAINKGTAKEDALDELAYDIIDNLFYDKVETIESIEHYAPDEVPITGLNVIKTTSSPSAVGFASPILDAFRFICNHGTETHFEKATKYFKLGFKLWLEIGKLITDDDKQIIKDYVEKQTHLTQVAELQRISRKS